MECPVRAVDFKRLRFPIGSVVSIGWLAIIAFLTIARLLINDFFSIDMLAIQSIFPAELIFDVNGIK
jgi:hypothetical protein